MNFVLNEEQQMFKKMVRDFAEKEVRPSAAERDENEFFDRQLYNQMGEIGLNGIPFPEKYGGAGADYLCYVIAVEELSRVCGSMGVTLSVNISLAGWPICSFGSEEQKQKYLKPLADGTHLGAFGLTESEAGSDAGALRTTARLEGDEWILNGSKIFITNAGEAETYVVFANTDKSKGHKGISAFILEKDTRGFSFGKKEKKLGIRSSPTVELIFEECHIPKKNLLGAEGDGFKIALATLDGGRVGIAAQAVGIAQGALDAAIDYSVERQQFGKSIASFQAIQFKLADMATKLDAARLLTYRAAWLKENGLPFSREAAMAKYYAGEACMAITTEAVQIFGGYGYSREYPVERFMRDAKITQIYEGTSEIQQLVIASQMIK